MTRPGLKYESWVIERVMEDTAGSLARAHELHPNLAAWFEREYRWPALYVDEGGET